MPTYQYMCTACGEDVEAVQSFSDPALTECPACAGRLRKVFGTVGVVFKGSGFYKTDSRAGGNGKAADKKDVKKGTGSPDSASKSPSSTSGTTTEMPAA